MHTTIEAVTRDIAQRSRESRTAYLDMCRRTQDDNPPKRRLSCGNLAHGYAACGEEEKRRIAGMDAGNIGIISAYNDMLSAHQPLAEYPAAIKQIALDMGATAQVASGVPAMCDGVTQGQPGMELSLFSRDVVAMATAIGLSHNLFDAAVCLGICDKIVPGMLIGALQFGHLPIAFVGSGPMATGIANSEKAKVRQQFAVGEASRDDLLAVESASYHSPGTCTFYGTANSNQVLMEMMGVQLPGSSFLHPDDELRPALLQETIRQLLVSTAVGDDYQPLYEVVTTESLVNALVALLATGGSTNHCLHLVAIAAAAGIELRLDDFSTLSAAVPLLARVYPNGSADINDFQRAGGMAFLVRELRGAGLLNENVVNLLGRGLDAHCCAPEASADGISWERPVESSLDESVLAPVAKAFQAEGGLRCLHGNLGDAVIKISAVAPEHRRVEAPCRVFDSQAELQSAFEAGELVGDLVAVVRFQGPAANGMPELHKLTPPLAVLQDRGQQVALLTDGRMSGASGKVPAAIHLTPEGLHGGAISRLRDGDMILLDAEAGILEVQLEESELQTRELATAPAADNTLGRGLFDHCRKGAGSAALGATFFAS